jgi:transitional endoplasmic reticulum ATPase
MPETVQLRVVSLPSDEAGRGIVRIDPKVMERLGLDSSGDIVEIHGKKTTGARVWRGQSIHAGTNKIFMDGLVRSNAGAGIGDLVEVRRIDPPAAKRVVLAPAQRGVRIVAEGSTVQPSLFQRPVTAGDVISTAGAGAPQGAGFPPTVMSAIEAMMRSAGATQPLAPFALGEIKFVVAQTTPKGIVKIAKETAIEIQPEAVEVMAKAPLVTYEDIGGLGDAIARVREMIELPIKHPELFDRLGIDPPKGVLLYGPPGTGKTLLARAVASESDANFISINGPEIMSKFYGESEKRLREIFEKAEQQAPTIIFIDEIDSIAPKREDVQGEVERRVVAQLLALMDGLQSRGKVIVIAATNRPEALDPALRRPGRFDREIELPVPNRNGRKEILLIHTRGMPLAKDVDLDRLADSTHGAVGADLAAICREAAMNTLRRILPKINLDEDQPLPADVLEELVVTGDDFNEAQRLAEPSAMREVFLEIPKVKWQDIGGLEAVKGELREAVEWPLKFPEKFEKVGVHPPRGILLIGPPGCGKTLLAKAVATESEANFIAIRGPEIFSKWVGESEKGIRKIFHKARQVAPSIVFFDELDSLAPSRGLWQGSHVYESVLNQLLAEMDGMEALRNVVVLGATNRPELIDKALLRPGRFDRIILVPPPDKPARLEILRVHTRSMPLDKNVDLNQLAERTKGFSGADLENLVREAGMAAIRTEEKISTISNKHFEAAFQKVKPSITPEMMKAYEDMITAMSTKRDAMETPLTYTT